MSEADKLLGNASSAVEFAELKDNNNNDNHDDMIPIHDNIPQKYRINVCTEMGFWFKNHTHLDDLFDFLKQFDSGFYANEDDNDTELDMISFKYPVMKFDDIDATYKLNDKRGNNGEWSLSDHVGFGDKRDPAQYPLNSEYFIIIDKKHEICYYININDDWRCDDLSYFKHKDTVNITVNFTKYLRYKFIKERVLYGQDNEFNVFRSLCFEDISDESLFGAANSNNLLGELLAKLTLSILSLLLQSVLCFGITYEVQYSIANIAEADDDEQEPIVILISIAVFLVLAFLTTETIRKFLSFYRNLSRVCSVSWLIIGFDFTSNVVIGLILSVTSFFFLIESENVKDVVLNSFALTFILEIDDTLNVFESDEAYLFAQDLEPQILGDYFLSLMNGDMDDLGDKKYYYILNYYKSKRKITLSINDTFDIKEITVTVGAILLSPLYLLYGFWLTLQSVYYFVCCCKHRDSKAKFIGDKNR